MKEAALLEFNVTLKNNGWSLYSKLCFFKHYNRYWWVWFIRSARVYQRNQIDYRYRIAACGYSWLLSPS